MKRTTANSRLVKSLQTVSRETGLYNRCRACGGFTKKGKMFCSETCQTRYAMQVNNLQELTGLDYEALQEWQKAAIHVWNNRVEQGLTSNRAEKYRRFYLVDTGKVYKGYTSMKQVLVNHGHMVNVHTITGLAF